MHAPTTRSKLLSLLSTILVTWCAAAQTNVAFKRTEDLVYGRKFGTALTMDVFEPAQKNGAAIAFMVSGGFYSSHEAINPNFYRPFLQRGYTVFAVVHGSQPKFTIPEIETDIHRAIRYIRHRARDFGVDAGRIGITGASAGGHLSLTMAAKGRQGDPGAKDAVDRQSSEVACAACFFPPTDFLNYSRPDEDAVGVGTLKDFKGAFGTAADTAEGRQKLGREISPIYFVHSKMPPVLIIHGDADTLVPIYQAQQFVEACEEKGVKAKLITREGKQHGWPGMEKDLEILADWFDEHLRK